MKFTVLAALIGVTCAEATESCENEDVKIARITLEGVDAHLKSQQALKDAEYIFFWNNAIS